MPKRMELTGTLMYFDKKNLNGRIYTKECAEKIVDQFNEKTKVTPMFGELGYPKRFEVSLDHVSHEITEIHIDEKSNSLVGTIHILERILPDKIIQCIKKGIKLLVVKMGCMVKYLQERARKIH